MFDKQTSISEQYVNKNIYFSDEKINIVFENWLSKVRFPELYLCQISLIISFCESQVNNCSNHRKRDIAIFSSINDMEF